MAKAAKSTEETEYTLCERITVAGTGKDSTNFPEGEERDIHPRVAAKLIKSGVVAKV